MKILSYSKAKLMKLLDDLRKRASSIEHENKALKEQIKQLQDQHDEHFYGYLAAMDELEMTVNHFYDADPKNEFLKLNFPKTPGSTRYHDRILAKLKKFKSVHQRSKRK